LLAYDATVTLISARGERTLPYRDFLLSYKKTVLAPDELVHNVTLLRNFSGYRQSIRKVGTRNAQAISKVAIAALARLQGGLIEEIRIGAASLREVPTRLLATEEALMGKAVTAESIAAARVALLGEARPIDDIRSSAKYRATVAGNLLEEFLGSLPR
jgi:CO/xanthine dehydrogenase FAD-binding subunit